MQVSTRVEEERVQCASLEQQVRVVPANNRHSVMEKLQSALQKSRIDRVTARPTGEGWS